MSDRQVLHFFTFPTFPSLGKNILTISPHFYPIPLSSSANKSRERPCYSKWITFKPISRSSIFAHSFYSHNAVRYFRQEIFFLGRSCFSLLPFSFLFSILLPSFDSPERNTLRIEIQFFYRTNEIPHRFPERYSPRNWPIEWPRKTAATSCQITPPANWLLWNFLLVFQPLAFH